MKTRTQTGFKTRLAAMLMLALVLLSAVGFGHQAMRGASFAPVMVAQAAEGDAKNVNDVFDIVGVNDDKITVGGDKVDKTFKPATLVDKSKGIAQVILGICTVISIIGLVINIARMAASGSNEQNRKKAQTAILWSGIALALFGGLSIVVGFFWGFLNGLG